MTHAFPVTISFLVACLILTACKREPAQSHAPVTDLLTTAQTADGRYISWREHIIDDPAIAAVPDLAGGDGLAMGDLNGDGNEDIVSVHETDTRIGEKSNGYVRIAWGSGDPGNWRLTTLASGTEVAAAEDVAIADANGDGHLDIVVACETAHLIYFQNPGINSESAKWRRTIPSITTSRGSFISVSFADLDNDGRPEIVAANKGHKSSGRDTGALGDFSIFILPENPLSGALWLEQVLGKALIPINSRPVDMDGDGDFDIVAGSRGEERMTWFENVGEMSFAQHDISLEDNSGGVRFTGDSTEFADINNDDRLDIVTIDLSRSMFWLQQPQAANFKWKANKIGTFIPDGMLTPALADIDGDGDLDAFAGGYSRGPRDADSENSGLDTPMGRIAWFENPGVAPWSPWQRHDVSRRKRGMYDQWLARDLDRDGDLDMIGTRGNSFPYDGVIWLEQIRSTTPRAAFQQAREVDSQEMPLPPLE